MKDQSEVLQKIPAEVMGEWTPTLRQEVISSHCFIYMLIQTDSESRCEEQIFSLKEAIACTQSDCRCECFQPGRHQIRSCDRCSHGWVTHAVSKVCGQTVVYSGQVEIVDIHVVFDISSLILYGTQALPVQMKILLDRLFSVLTHTQVLNIIHTLGWTLRDYIRGYKLQDSTGKVLDGWVTMSPEDELITLQQFLRFGETRSIVQLMVEEQRVSEIKGASDACVSTDQRSTSFTERLHFENLFDVFLQPFNYTSPSLPPHHHHPVKQLQHLRLEPRRDTDEMSTQVGGEKKPKILTRGGNSVQTSDGPLQLYRETIKPSTRPLKSFHDKQQVGDVNTQVKLVEVPDSSSSGARERRHGSSFGKGRVSCCACAKTFYDKGTLKIHFNAVHLKIKHRCTIEGCNMMFSSLRSRNRHSANPNPRLHSSQHLNPRLTTRSCYVGRSTFKMCVAQPIPDTPSPVLPERKIPLPSRPCVAMATNHQNSKFSNIFETHTYSGSGGGARRNRTANERDLDHVRITVPKKNPRKSSTPLKFKRESTNDDDEASKVKLTRNQMIRCRNTDGVTLLPRQSVSRLHSSTHYTTNSQIWCSISEDEDYSEVLSSISNSHKQHHSKHLHKTPGSDYYGNHSNNEK
ncbi:zinc finger protein basonuclin-2 [Paramisgurnus dabryanus]|uniref:zinc finger protein basonuclin-2 n=1 Tax=Paramisgurnus dabryanus TaxID=90735 RepID=UPI0031F3B20F